MPKALDVAKYIVNESTLKNYQISNLKLQKILFLLQRDFLKQGKEAFEDDIEAIHRNRDNRCRGRRIRHAVHRKRNIF